MLRRANRCASPLQQWQSLFSSALRTASRFAGSAASSSAPASTAAGAGAGAATAKGPATCSLSTPDDLLRYKKQSHALYLLKKTPHVALSAEAALQLLVTEDNSGNGGAKLHLIPAEERMTRAEALAFLRACHDAGVVIVSPAPGSAAAAAPGAQQMVYPDPVAVFDARRQQQEAAAAMAAGDGEEGKAAATTTSSSSEMHGADFLVQAKENRVRKLRRMLAQRNNESVEAEHEDDLHLHDTKDKTQVLVEDADVVAARAVRSHRRFWALMAFGMSCQMLLFANWTFLEYGWDVMEPFSYFTGCFYMLVFFGYFVVTKRGHTFIEMDKAVLRRAVARSAAQRPV